MELGRKIFRKKAFSETRIRREMIRTGRMLQMRFAAGLARISMKLLLKPNVAKKVLGV
jgi:hypothetical protein